MLSSGVAVGLFVFGVAEPLWHQADNYFAEAGYRSQDEIDLFALNMSVSNWGIAGWSVYALAGLAVSLAAHRFGLPLTIRSCFYPILGKWTWGWIGDVVDSLTICVTIMGMCTSLGMGAIQLVGAFKFLGWTSEALANDYYHTRTLESAMVWMVTLLTIISVVSGLHGGVRVLSVLAVSLGAILSLLLLFLDHTTFLLNLQVQELGYFLQHSIFELNLWTDAFGQLKSGTGRAIDGKASAQWWMDAWMIFYQAWWVSWSAFVGVFLARISRGRTIREFLLFTLAAPVGVCMAWFSIWGGIGLRQHRQALEMESLGQQAFNDSNFFRLAESTCFSVPQENVVVNGTTLFVNNLHGVTPVW